MALQVAKIMPSETAEFGLKLTRRVQLPYQYSGHNAADVYS
jgi:hypothetical protein